LGTARRQDGSWQRGLQIRITSHRLSLDHFLLFLLNWNLEVEKIKVIL
jgi:hypothetical protein